MRFSGRWLRAAVDSMTPPRAMFCLALLCCLAAGCESNHYRLEMSVEGDTLQRELTCWRQTGGNDDRRLLAMPDAELQRIADAYGVDAPPSAERKFTFSGDFSGSTPNDIGGAGSLAMWTSDLGRSWAYVERFRGDDDLTASIDQRREAVDAFVAVLIDWLHGELGDGPEFVQAEQLLKGTLKSDLSNLAAYAWTAAAVNDVTQSGQHDFEFGLRAAMFAAERDYFDLGDFPGLVQSIEKNDSGRLLNYVRSALATKLGKDALGAEWDFIENDESLQASINEHLQQHPGYLKFVRKRQAADPDASPPPPTEYVGGLAIATIGLGFGDFDGLEASLQCPVEPYRTNGTWSADEGTVFWNRPLNPIDARPRSVLPPMLFAMWSVPEADYQTARFGRVILKDEALTEYCQWHALLSPEQRQQWSALIGGLAPRSPAAEWIEDFRFAPHDEDAEALAARGRELLLGPLQPE